MSLIGISPNYAILLFLVATAGLGAAAFHPPAFSTVVRSSNTSRGETMGIFLPGGNAGFFLGPMVAGIVVPASGLPGTLVLLPMGLLIVMVLLKAPIHKDDGSPARPKHHGSTDKRLVGLLVTITAFRSISIEWSHLLAAVHGHEREHTLCRGHYCVPLAGSGSTRPAWR